MAEIEQTVSYETGEHGEPAEPDPPKEGAENTDPAARTDDGDGDE